MAYSFPCDWKAAFVPDPVKKDRIGYLTDFEGLGASRALEKDLTLYYPSADASAPTYAPLGSHAHGTVRAVGVIETISWAGGVGDAFHFDCYMSQENASRLKALSRTTLKTNAIRALGWWVGNYDEEKKEWFEEHFPLQPSTPPCQLNVVNPKDARLYVADDPVRVAPNIDVPVFNVSFEVVPAQNQVANLQVAVDPGKKVVLPWGVSGH